MANWAEAVFLFYFEKFPTETSKKIKKKQMDRHGPIMHEIRRRVARYVAGRNGSAAANYRLIFKPDAPASGERSRCLWPMVLSGPDFTAACDKLAQGVVYAAENLAGSRRLGGTITVTDLVIDYREPTDRLLDHVDVIARYCILVDDEKARQCAPVAWTVAPEPVTQREPLRKTSPRVHEAMRWRESPQRQHHHH